MSSDRREFLKSLTLGGIALFTADWFKLVDETKAASGGKLLPALPGEKVSDKGDQLRAFWNDSEGYFELCVNGTIYDEVPDFEDEDAEEFDDSEFEQDEESPMRNSRNASRRPATNGRASKAPTAKAAARSTSSIGIVVAARAPRRYPICRAFSASLKPTAKRWTLATIPTSARSTSMTEPARATIRTSPPRRLTMRPSPRSSASSSPSIGTAAW